MSTHQVKVSESQENGKEKGVTNKKNGRTEKRGHKDEAVLAKINDDSKKETK